ncbi:nitrate- and nitrite sensing domain-containing protein [Streptomyces sp. NPDC020681]|uniref:sensor histidine kinase n=1 Tax=Streptomyces sp. NPDC020681 TaxID=3365083 RepID=UPI003793E063
MRFADLSVRRRVAVLGVVPLTAAALLTTPLVVDRVQSAGASRHDASHLDQARQLGGLLTELQRERLLANVYLATKASETTAITRQTVRTDAAADDFSRHMDDDAPPAITRALTQAGGLGRTRELILDRKLDPAEVNALYGGLISGLIDGLGLADTDADGVHVVGREHSMVEALLRTDEHSSALGAGLLAAISSPEEARQRVSDLAGIAAAQETERERFLRLALPSETQQFQAAEASTSSARVQAFANSLKLWAEHGSKEGTALGELAEISTIERIAAAADSLDQQRLLVQNKVVYEAARSAEGEAADATELAVYFALAALVLAGSMVWLTIRIGRSIVGPLQELQGAAEEIAQAAETELSRVAEESTQDPGQSHIPMQLQRVLVSSNDELGLLASHFNRVQDAAVELIERQIRSSQNASAMLVNVGRRTQNLSALQLLMIDELERVETDGVLLEKLYRLDHVTTRLRRYADSLLVLSGRPEKQLVGSPVPLDDLTRSALAKVEDFSRVQVLGELPDSPVVSHVASDLALAVAELLDNATSYSPPHTTVELSLAELPNGGCLLRIVDHGVGLSDERLAAENARLGAEERLDRAPTESLGLFVVGRICRRHAFAIGLDHTAEGGLTVRLKVPSSAFARGLAQLAEGTTQGGRTQEEIRPLTVVPDPVDHSERYETGAPNTGQFTWFGGPPPHAASAPDSGGQHRTAAVTSYSMGVERGRVSTASAASSFPEPPMIYPLPVRDTGASPASATLDKPRLPIRDKGAAGTAPTPAPTAEHTKPRHEHTTQHQEHTAPQHEQSSPHHEQMQTPPHSEPTPPLNGSVKLVRRVPGAQLPAGAFVPNGAVVGPRPTADPDAARAMIQQFEQGIARAMESGPDSPSFDQR